jgi:uncharacterized protein YecE (DUF72 family)
MPGKLKPASIEKHFYCGTSNVVLPVANKSFFPDEYQSKSRLAYYGSILNSLEINSTFYKLPMPRTVEKWTNEVPGNFRFTFKLSKAITHAKELQYSINDIREFMTVVDAAGDKKGCILVQFPASIKVSFFRKVRQLLDDILASGRVDEWNLAIEFRDKSWYQDRVYQMLEYYKAAIVMHDMPKSFTPLIDMERSFVYLRFHGELGNYRGGYSNDFLREHASNIQDWLDENLPVYAYFNNTMGDAIHNAMTLQTYILDL